MKFGIIIQKNKYEKVNLIDMNKEVSLPLAKLLKEKGYNKSCYHYYYNNELVFMSSRDNWNAYSNGYSAPTIADVVMWLYEKHGIWVWVYQYKDHAADNNDPFSFRSNATGSKEFNNPTEAYEAAIELALNKLI